MDTLFLFISLKGVPESLNLMLLSRMDEKEEVSVHLIDSVPSY